MQNTLVSDRKTTLTKSKYKRLAENSAGCIRQRNPHEERSAPKENYIWRNKEMSTEILGYIGQVQKTPQTNENAPQQAKKVNKDKLYYIKQKLAGVILIALGAISVPVSEGDGTAFVMMLFIGLALIATKDKVLMIGENDDD